MIIVIALLICLTAIIKEKFTPEIVLKVKNQSMLQDEEIPNLRATASFSGKKKIVLDKKSKYTVQDLVEDLNQGKGYRLKHKIDGEKEGSYSVSIVLDKEMEKKFNDKWNWKVKLRKENGKFEVKNKYGIWEKDKFKRLDDTYVTSDFIVSNGKSYYFDEEGNKVTGWQTIGGFKYFFDKEGMMHTGWRKTKKGTYYFQKDGKMTVGWETIKDNTYYFNSKGKMVTGKQIIGKSKCVFRKDGTLKSREDKIDPNRPMVAFTFDDGPGKYTDRLLNQFDKYDAHATFFMLGENAAKYPDEIKKMEKIGCELANHSMTHANLTKLDEKGIRKEIEGAQLAIAKAAGHGGRLVRPPYGALNALMKDTADMPFIMWSLDTLDWKRKDAGKIKEYVLNHIEDGDIILMHDIHEFSVDAAIALVPELIEKGYQLVTVSEMAEARGIEMKNGEKYFSFYKE